MAVAGNSQASTLVRFGLPDSPHALNPIGSPMVTHDHQPLLVWLGLHLIVAVITFTYCDGITPDSSRWM